MPAKAKTAIQDGETLLVDKAKIPPKFIELSEKAAQKALAKENAPREKRPLSEKQKENLQRLIELNKKRREEKLAAARVNVDELGEIPEDKVLVKVVKGKGAGRKPGRPSKKQAPSESEHEVVEEEPALPPPMPKVKRQPKHQPEPEPEPESEPSPPKVRKARPAPTPKPKPKPVRRPRSYYSETSETSGVDADSDSESEDEEVVKHKVQKYVEKTKARMEALRQIEQQLKPTNKYSGMSIF